MLFLVAAVVLAGCAGSATPGIETTTTDDAVETTDGIETTTDGRPVDLPPGVNESGIENASRLLEADRQALAESGYAFRMVRSDSSESEYYSRTVSRGTVAKNFAPFRIRTEGDIRYGNQTIRAETDVWGNESVVLVEYRERNRTSYQKYVDEPNDPIDPYETFPGQALSGQLSHGYVAEFSVLTGEYEVESVERRDGLTLTTLRATELNRSFDERDTENVSRFDATLVVDEHGRIHRANLTMQYQESTFSYDFELTKIGGVAVAYPSWADRALATGNATAPPTTAGESTTTGTE